MSSPMPPKSKYGVLSSLGGKYTTLRGSSGNLFGFIIGGPTDELHPFTKSSESGLDYSTDSTALLSGILQDSIWEKE